MCVKKRCPNKTFILIYFCRKVSSLTPNLHLNFPKNILGPANPFDPDVGGKIFRSNNPTAPIYQKIFVSLAINLAWCASYLVLIFKRDMLYPVFLVRMVPGLVDQSDSLVLAPKNDIICPTPTIRKEYKRIVDFGKSKTSMHVLQGGHCTMLRDDKEKYTDTIRNFIDSLPPDSN